MSGGSWLPFYLIRDDMPTFLRLFDDEIAAIIPDGPGRWRAARIRDAILSGRHALWHLPSGPLPFWNPQKQDAEEKIDDPWAGWAERRLVWDMREPYFGPGHPGIVWLNLNMVGHDPDSMCGLSSFGWIGNRYSLLGQPAHPLTQKWWNRLRRNVAKQCTKLPRRGFVGTGVAEIWTFPHALDLLSRGVIADLNPWSGPPSTLSLGDILSLIQLRKGTTRT